MRIPIFGRKKLIAAFEYGLHIADVARQQNVTLTKELVQKAEDMIVNELSTRSCKDVVMDTIPNIISVFEPKEKRVP